MKNALKLFGIAVITAVIGFSMVTCENGVSGGGGGGKKGGKQDGLVKYVMDVRDVPDSEWDIMIVGADGSSMAFNMDESTGFITRMVVKPEKDSDVTNSWVFNEDGLPDMMASNGYLFYYNNFNGYTFDMAVEKPDGTIEYYYDKETDVNWDTFNEIFIQGDSVPKRSVQARSAIDDFFEGALKGADGVNTGADVIGKFVGVLSCLTALTNPVSLAGCGIFVLQETASIFVKVAFDGIAEDTGLMLIDALGCVTLDPLDCVGAATGLLSVLTSDDLKRVIPKFKVKGVTMSETTLTVASRPILDDLMYLTLSDYLSFNITPAYATNKLARWSSSDLNIVSTIASDSALPDSCRVWGKKPGTATITITTWDGNYTASCVVTVNPPPPPVDVTGVTLDKTAINLSVHSELDYAGQLINVGDSTLIEATVQPSNATDKEVTWSSSNDAVARVYKYNSTQATVTAVAEGTATITVTTSLNNGIRYAATCVVTVTTDAVGEPAEPIINYSEMVWVPGGTFEMGKNLGNGGGNDVTPVHTVTLTGFYMGKYEVTQARWKEIMGELPNMDRGVGDNFPIYRINFYDIIEFCNKLSIKEGLSPAYNRLDSMITIVAGSTGYRLPTEAQWEYAAKGGNPNAEGWVGYTYSGSDESKDVGWFASLIPELGNNYGETYEVGKKLPNNLGLYDMSGNVTERCWESYTNYSSEAQTDPVKITISSGDNTVNRGGGVHVTAPGTRLVDRAYLSMNYGSSYPPVGIRLVRP